MTINISTQPVEIARFAGAVYGLVLDGATATAVEGAVNVAGSSLNAVLNGIYGIDFANAQNANVATTVAANLGLTGNLATQASAYITAQLNAAAPGTQGQALMNVLNLFGTLTSDPTWGAAATAWENTVSQSVSYSLSSANTSNVGIAALAQIGQTVTVTAGINQVFNGSPTGGTSFNVTNVSLNNGETITGFGVGNVLNVVEQTSIDTTFGGATFSPKITGIQTANLFAGQAVGGIASTVAADTTAWTGLTQLNATAPGGITLNAAATTNIDANSQSNVTSGGPVTITGGDNVTVTSGSAVNVSGAAGAVTVGSVANPVSGNVTVDGGNGVSIDTSGPSSVTVGVTNASGVATPVTGNVTVIDTNLGSTGLGPISVDGGSNVAITATGMIAAEFQPSNGITVGANAAPTGTITINAVLNNAVSGVSVGDVDGFDVDDGVIAFGTINVTGGTVDTINETLLNTTSTVTGLSVVGAVTVTGGSATTTVTVNQAAPVKTVVGANAAAGNGVVGVGVVAAAPGIQGVTAVTASPPTIAPTPAVAAVLGNGITADGLVNIHDANAPSSIAATLAANSGTISTVTLSNFAGANISSAALKTLSVSGDASSSPVNLYEGGSTAATNTTLALTTSGLGSSTLGVINPVLFTDNSNQYTVMNVTTGPVSSYLNLQDTALTTLNVSGSSVLDLSQSTLMGNALTAVNVSGAAGFSGALDATATTFLAGSSTGMDTITIAADATTKITAGTNTGNELILNAVGNTFTAANTGANVSGFSTVGLDASVGSSTVDLSVFGTGIKNVVDIADTGSIVLNNVASTSTLTLDVSTASVIYTTGDTTGTTDAVTVTLASPVASTYRVGAPNTAMVLNLQDKLGQGIGHVNIVSNNVGFATNNVITTLTDNNISVLNVSGTAGLTVSNLTQQSGTGFTINNIDTGNYITAASVPNVSLASIVDTNLTNLTFSGSNNSAVTTVTDNVGVTALTIANTGTSTAQVNHLVAPQLTSLTLNGNVGLGTMNIAFGLSDSVTAGVTISGATDNSQVNVSLTVGAAPTKTDNITLGNGNNNIDDASATGNVNVTVGSGANHITVGKVILNTIGLYDIVLGTHASTLTAFDQVLVGTMGHTYGTGAPTALPVTNYVIHGAGANDAIYLRADVATTVATAVALNTNLNNPLLGAAALSSAGGLIANLEVAAATTLHSVQYAYFGGNTYIAEASAAASGTTMTLVELTGIHTIATTTATLGTGHLITLAS